MGVFVILLGDLNLIRKIMKKKMHQGRKKHDLGIFLTEFGCNILKVTTVANLCQKSKLMLVISLCLLMETPAGAAACQPASHYSHETRVTKVRDHNPPMSYLHEKTSAAGTQQEG